MPWNRDTTPTTTSAPTMSLPWRSSAGAGTSWPTSIVNVGTCWARARTITTIWWSGSREWLSLRDVRPGVASFGHECLEDGEIAGGAEWLRWPPRRQRGRSGGECVGLELVELRLRDRPAVEEP